MKQFLLITFLFSTLLASSQSHQFIPDSGAYWTIGYHSWTSYYTENPYGVQGDTLINGNIYLKIVQSNDSVWDSLNTEYFCATRQVDDKWMFYSSGTEEEHLLYDFDVAVGDTIDINNPWAAGEVQALVNDIDSVLIDGDYRMRIHLEASSGNFEEVWIEGIGSSNGLFYTGYYLFDAGYSLMCFHIEDALLYLDSPNDDCYYVSVGLDEHEEAQWWSMSPNPAGESFSINTYRANTVIESLQVIDAAGRLVLDLKPRDITIEVSLIDLDTGLYTVLLGYDEGKLSAKQLMVNR